MYYFNCFRIEIISLTSSFINLIPFFGHIKSKELMKQNQQSYSIGCVWLVHVPAVETAGSATATAYCISCSSPHSTDYSCYRSMCLVCSNVWLSSVVVSALFAAINVWHNLAQLVLWPDLLSLQIYAGRLIAW